MREEIWLDTTSGDPVVAKDILYAGQTYRVTLQGTFNVWPNPSSIGSHSGASEAAPMWPTPGKDNGPVGLDPEFAFAWPPDSELENSATSGPQRVSSVQISLDAGATWSHPDNAQPYDPTRHAYHYEVVGAEHPLQVRFVDAVHQDDYGRLRIVIERDPHFEPERLATGGNHSLVLTENGSIVAFGEGRKGQIGDGAATNRYAPVTLSEPTHATAVGVGQDHSLAITADGQLWAWGDNSSGQLGADGATESTRSRPALVAGIGIVTQATGGQQHTLALTRERQVFAWGDNRGYQLGDEGESRHQPRQVAGLPEQVRHLAAGNYHSLALAQDGSVWTWGENSAGQLGDGSRTKRATPQKVPGLPTDIRDIAAGDNYSLALAADGSVWGWGQGDIGTLGEESAMKQLTPVQVADLQNIVAIAGADKHCLALSGDGKIWSWGTNQHGELGDGTTENSATVVSVVGLDDVLAVVANCGQHNLAVTVDCKVWGWGRNHVGQLGCKDAGIQADKPFEIPELNLLDLPQ